MILKAYILPHPPIILKEIGRGEEKKIQKTIDSFEKVAREIAEIKPDTIVLTSPHAPSYCDAFYMANAPEFSGSLAQFGRRDLELKLELDQEFAEAIYEETTDLSFAFRRENQADIDHGSFIPLSFITNEYKDFKIVSIGISGLDAQDHFKLGKYIRAASEKLGRKTVFVASGDLSHVLKEDGPYGFKKAGPEFDNKLIGILSKADFKSLLDFPEDLIDQAAQCGIRSFQIMAGALGDDNLKAEFLSYENTFGVGYGVFSFTPSIDEDDAYIDLAKNTINEYIKNQRIINIPEHLPEEMLKDRAGCFVSLHKDGELRGCIGTLEPVRNSIAEEIISNAISASTRDPRFQAVRPEEVDDLVISVDVLRKAERIDSIDQLDPLVYGVIVSKGYRKGVLLPNLEGINDAEFQVSIALRKAGIHPSEDYELERFKVIRHE